MTWANVLLEVRQMRFEELSERRQRRTLTMAEAVEFYAGWGLTHDLVPLTRRTRRLTLDELVAGALILYPTYVSRTTGKFTTPERALDELLDWRQQQNGVPLWRKSLRLALRFGKR
jgi:capsular polysaccharide export protein